MDVAAGIYYFGAGGLDKNDYKAMEWSIQANDKALIDRILDANRNDKQTYKILKEMYKEEYKSKK